MGVALWFAQQGLLHPLAKPMKGRLAGVTEIREDYDRGTYRVMYTAKLGDTLYVLCAFQKKAVRGVATPQPLLDRVEARLRQAVLIAKQRGESS